MVSDAARPHAVVEAMNHPVAGTQTCRELGASANLCDKTHVSSTVSKLEWAPRRPRRPMNPNDFVFATSDVGSKRITIFLTLSKLVLLREG